MPLSTTEENRGYYFSISIFGMEGRSPPEGYEDRYAIVAELFSRGISTNTAAQRLATLTLEGEPEDEEDDAEGRLEVTWGSIMLIMRRFPEQAEKLADLLVCMASLPDVKDDNEGTLLVDDERVWGVSPLTGRTWRLWANSSLI